MNAPHEQPPVSPAHRRRLDSNRTIVPDLQDVVGVGALAVVSSTTAMTFARIFDGWSFLPPLLVVVVVSHSLALLSRLLRVPFLIALPLIGAMLYVVIGHLALASTLRYGLPLGRSWDSFSSQMRESWHLLGDVVPPVASDSGFGLVALVASGLAAVLADAFAFRFGGRFEAFVPTAVIFVVLAAVGTERLRIPMAALWIGTVLAAVAVMRAGDRARHVHGRADTTGRRRMRTYVRLVLGGTIFAAAIAAGAAFAGPRLPGADQEAWLLSRQRGDTRVLEPLVDIRRRLGNPTDQVLFTMAAEQPSYWRLTALPIFDGSTWTVPGSLLGDAGGELAAVDPSPPPGLDVVPNFQRLRITSLAGDLLPIAYEPVQLRAASRSLYYERRIGSVLVGGDGLQVDDSFELVSNIASPRPELLASASVSSPPTLDNPDATYLEVPDTEEVDRLRQIVSGIVDRDAPPYQQALSIQTYFRDTFTYSLDVPDDLDGDATLAFLERRTGYCEQFASTFALFARILDIPSRVAVGFTPGEVIGEEGGRKLYEVRSQHAHAWPEVWFDGIGWVLFEPTPGRGAPNAGYTNVPEQQDESTPAPSPEAPLATTTTSSVAPATPAPDRPALETPATSQSVESDSRPWWPWLVAIALVISVWFFALPRSIHAVAERRRTHTILDSWRRVVALNELRRGRFDPSLSPAEIAASATSRLWDEDPFIIDLATRVTEYLYAGASLDTDETRHWHDLTETYLRERFSRLPLRTRLRARLDPRTMFLLAGTRRSGEPAPH